MEIRRINTIFNKEGNDEYVIYNKKTPNEFPCIIVLYVIENDYFDSNTEGKYNTLLHSSYFPEVTFENSPREVELKLVNLCG